MKEIGSLISALRKEKGYSQETLAGILGCTKQTISNYERNTRTPDYETLEAIADTFNVPMGFFLSEEEQEEKLNQIYKSYESLSSSKLQLIMESGSLEGASPKINAAIMMHNKRKQQEEDELWAIREEMRRNPEIRMLFSASRGAKKEHIAAAAAMLKALKGDSDE